MALQTGEVAKMRYRRPWYVLAILLLAASVTTWLIYLDARSRIALNERQFNSALTLRLRGAEHRSDDYFLVTIQLAGVGSQLLDRSDLPPERVRDIIVTLFDARRNQAIYGLGVFYAPFAYDPKYLLYSDYVHRLPVETPLDVVLPGGVVDVFYKGNPPLKAGEDYFGEGWYQKAVRSPASTVFKGPYLEDGRHFISTLKAFVIDGKTVGVVSVDTRAEIFRANLEADLARGDVADIEDRPGGKVLLTTTALPADRSTRIEQVMPLRYSGVWVRISADAKPLLSQNRQVVSVGAGLGMMVWGFAGVLGFSILRAWRSREKNALLEQQREQLENELAVGKKVEAELRKTAYTDSLTGLPNRAAFFDRASAALQGGRARSYAVFFIDLDRFNMVNETMGHVAGDELLKTIGARLRSALPPETMVARIGGDEFLVLAEVHALDAGGFARHLLAILHEPMLLAGRAVYTEASIGVAPIDDAYRNPEEVLRDADIALYAAKGSGRNGYAIFDETMRRKVASDSDLDNDLRRAVERHEFVPYYQPIVSIETHDVISFEALVRWQRPGRGIAGAAEFIEFAESRGIVDAIDGLVLDAVCADARELFDRFPDATVAVNLSAAHLTAPGLAASIERSLQSRTVAPERVKLEITETAIMQNAALARVALEGLRGNGMQIVLDDFGAGHSSLAYLHRLPIAGLKIDRSFIEPLAQDQQAVAIVRSIVALAQTLQLYTVAEGVETQAQLDVLRQLGVPYAQGFFFSPALALAELMRYSVESTAS